MIASTENAFHISSSCDHTDVGEVLVRLKQRVEAATPENPLSIELTEGRPTAIALQLAASAARSLGQKAAFAGYGETVAKIIVPATDH